MARLLEYFVPLFSFGLAIDEQVASGSSQGGVDEVYARARLLIEQARSTALTAGKPPAAVESAAFAVVAWFDEIITRNPLWWSQASPLQVSLFNTNNAGNEFFEHLSNLKGGDEEVREVYYHALLLGFVGQYYYETGDHGELGKIKELNSRQLPVAPAPLHTLREEQITPQPYLMKDPTGPRYPKQWDALLMKIGAVIALAIPLAYLVWFFMSPARVTGPTVQQMVDQETASYNCAALTGTVDKDGVTAVSGYVSKSVDLERLRSDIAGIKGVKTPSYQVKVLIWPHCEVVKMLTPYRQRNLDRHDGLAVTPTTGHSDRFIKDEKVMVKLTQASHEGYLYVDYYTVEGEVVHILPNSRDAHSGQVIPASQQFDVGKLSDGTGWITVEPPFGQELITIVASPTPLYTGFRPDSEPAKDYLPLLKASIDANHADDKFVADFMTMQTEPAQ
ncbi:DotU family type IV/VI secretion system protein [Rhodanobacter sp. L36]|uniref:DotU family type IV/VI secretion system protein n=1 Tax=Rhodanobacter sp. L36 TaxID=1747221 RepID=UPI00131D8E1D|nr:DotU family type IV/VI secretion system protein [Rhodanobacter sp. L36]